MASDRTARKVVRWTRSAAPSPRSIARAGASASNESSRCQRRSAKYSPILTTFLILKPDFATPGRRPDASANCRDRGRAKTRSAPRGRGQMINPRAVLTANRFYVADDAPDLLSERLDLFRRQTGLQLRPNVIEKFDQAGDFHTAIIYPATPACVPPSTARPPSPASCPVWPDQLRSAPSISPARL